MFNQCVLVKEIPRTLDSFSSRIFEKKKKKGLLSFLLYLHHIPKTTAFSSSKNFSFPAVWTSAHFSTFIPMSFENCNPSKSISYRFIKTCFIIFPALCEHLLIQKESQVTFDTWQTFFYRWFYLKAKHNKHPQHGQLSHVSPHILIHRDVTVGSRDSELPCTCEVRKGVS